MCFMQMLMKDVKIMTFDEAIDKIDVNGTLIDTLGVLQALQQEYAPTIEMTKVGKNYLLYYLENSSFGSFISDINLVRSGTIGVEPTDYFEDLSDEDLMQAWLRPDTIKVVDE